MAQKKTNQRIDVKSAVADKLSRYFNTSFEAADSTQLYKAIILSLRDMLAEKRRAFKVQMREAQSKRVYYLCMEFLLGPSLQKTLFDLELTEEYRALLAERGISLESILELEPDPGLGNGGLGRLAACYMDALAHADEPAFGFSILYEYGLFRQKIVDGMQVELADDWRPMGDVWLIPRDDRIYTVRLGGHTRERWNEHRLVIEYENAEEIRACPCDMLISGKGAKGVSVLRLWQAKDAKGFDMNLFSQGQYSRAMQDSNSAEVISKVLYPNDNHNEGKLLRLSQQYFLVSASIQSILHDHFSTYGTMENLADKVAIHLNDTHPALCIPELMRLLMDEHGFAWEAAWEIVAKTISYTNHTVLPEALEKWDEDFFRLKLPRIYDIVREINRRFCEELWNIFPGDWNRISRMSILCENKLNMANLCVASSYRINGVSALHTSILEKDLFANFYAYKPQAFTNVTNGVAHRRFLCMVNPGLMQLFKELSVNGVEDDAQKLEGLLRYQDDSEVLAKLYAIKQSNKEHFSEYLWRTANVRVDPEFVFDVQIKRLHEYKRQLLNVLQIIHSYSRLLDDPNAIETPQCFLFGAKAPAGYYMAKEIIRLICALGAEIAKNPRISKYLQVVFLENYRVSLSEKIIPAADFSEQISLAGKEASGTGNMKLMMNGALTIGTLDGANVEISELVGEDNIFLFGLREDEVRETLERGYSSSAYYQNDERLQRVTALLKRGFDSQSFEHIANYLLTATGLPDPYLCFADFASYHETKKRALDTYGDRAAFQKKSLVNIAKSGFFSADRSVKEYAERIWDIRPLR